MTQITAKTVEDVKKWVAENKHHFGTWLSEKRKPLYSNTDVPAFFKLKGYTNTIIIPKAINELCFLTPYGAEEGSMYRWDDLAEKIAPDIGKMVTTSVETYEYIKDKGFEKVGIRQGILKEVRYNLMDSDSETTPYFIVEGTLAKYAMNAKDAYVIVENPEIFHHS